MCIKSLPDEISIEFAFSIEDIGHFAATEIYCRLYPQWEKQLKEYALWDAADLYGHVYPESIEWDTPI